VLVRLKKFLALVAVEALRQLAGSPIKAHTLRIYVVFVRLLTQIVGGVNTNVTKPSESLKSREVNVHGCCPVIAVTSPIC
jgi:hypothetical protein